jgi:hypothetical protein
VGAGLGLDRRRCQFFMRFAGTKFGRLRFELQTGLSAELLGTEEREALAPLAEVAAGAARV